MAEDKAKILVVDDNEDLATMIKAMLQIKGYNITVKTNVTELENFVKQLNPGLIIIDMLLSGANGCEFCKAIKNNTETAHIPVLMFSAHPNAKSECLNAGANFFLEKPFDIKDLFSAVEKLLVAE